MHKTNNELKNDFESIIPTALHTLYPLSFTDIPFSSEIYSELCKFGFPNELKNEKITFEIEARYKLIDKFLKESNITQILELASGFTPRGLNWCLSNKNITYVEVDLPQVIEKKKKLLENIIDLPKNLHFVGGNALLMSDLQKSLNHFDLSKPIAVINQGLMRYLDFDEKKTLAKNIFSVIEQNNGLWITCDLTPAKFIQTQNKNIDTNYNNNLSQVTNRNNASWRFKDKQHAEEFLKEIGLCIDWHEFTESLQLLSSPEKFNLSLEETKKFLENAYVSIIKLAL